MKVFIVVEEKNWKNCEYTDVVSAHATKDKATESFQKCVEGFKEDYKEDLNEIKDNEWDYEEKVKDDYYSFLDECVGYYYEVSIIERDLD